jgi:hypothetical protein
VKTTTKYQKMFAQGNMKRFVVNDVNKYKFFLIGNRLLERKFFILPILTAASCPRRDFYTPPHTHYLRF